MQDDLTPERVAKAIAHLLEVAAAYDDEPSADDNAARSMLSKVCRAIEVHAKRTADRRYRVATKPLLGAASSAFEALRKRERTARRASRGSTRSGTASAARAHRARAELPPEQASVIVRRIAPYVGVEDAQRFVALLQASLAEGPPPSDESAAPYRAAQVVAQFQEVSVRAVHQQTKRDLPHTLPAAFGTAVTSTGRIAYALWALGWPRALARKIALYARTLRED